MELKIKAEEKQGIISERTKKHNFDWRCVKQVTKHGLYYISLTIIKACEKHNELLKVY